jgi:hypothetical protein
MYGIRRIPVRAILLAALLAVSAVGLAAASAQAAYCEDCEMTGDGGAGGGGAGGGGGGGGSAGPLQLAQHIVTWSEFGHLGTGDKQCTQISPDQGLCGIDDDVDRTLVGGDHVLLGEQNGGPFGVGASEIEVMLRTAPSITWWKEIKAFTAEGRALACVETKGDNHTPSRSESLLVARGPPRSCSAGRADCWAGQRAPIKCCTSIRRSGSA